MECWDVTPLTAEAVEVTVAARSDACVGDTSIANGETRRALSEAVVVVKLKLTPHRAARTYPRF